MRVSSPTALPNGCEGPDAALALFDRLAPVDTAFMIGTWTGHEFPTGHPMDGALTAFGWRGKRFDDEEQVHPLLFASGEREFAVNPRLIWPGVPLLLRYPQLKAAPVARIARALLPLLATHRSHARLRSMRFRGTLTATMIYDDVPIQDVFRAADDDTVLGLMDLKGMKQPFFFLLRRKQAVRDRG
jgi:hypothetical protein